MAKTEFERITNVRLPFDMRNAEDGHNYGIHGLDVWFVLKGPLGAVQFMVNFGVYLPHLDAAQNANLTGITGFDVGYHSHVPLYDGQSVQLEKCDLLGGPCYYDGSSVVADEWAKKIFSTKGKHPEDVMWPMLEQYYRETFGSKEDN